MITKMTDDLYNVLSSDEKGTYEVDLGKGTCTCKDYTFNKGKIANYKCKHISLVIDSLKNKPKLDKEFIITLQGKEFVKYAGLLDLAHQIGLESLCVEVIQYPNDNNGNEAICKATATSKEGNIFIDIGDASPKNVNRMIALHILRMASTRAKARALRDFTNVGMTAIEELAEETPTSKKDTPENEYKKLHAKALKLLKEYTGNENTDALRTSLKMFTGKNKMSELNEKDLQALIYALEGELDAR